MKELIGYRRVSTKWQGQSGLGLDAQQEAIERYAQQIGATIVGTYTEVETGKRADRPELARALAHARRRKAVLCVAKLDRLARNVAFTSTLMRSGVDFVACDNPAANKLTIHILAAVAEDEAERISTRVREALAQAKRRGRLLGSARPDHWKGREDRRRIGAKRGSKAAAKGRIKAALDAYADLLGELQTCRKQGMSLRQMCRHMESQGHRTRSGAAWTPMLVLRILRRSKSS